jgi:hypothetical protein
MRWRTLAWLAALLAAALASASLITRVLVPMLLLGPGPRPAIRAVEPAPPALPGPADSPADAGLADAGAGGLIALGPLISAAGEDSEIRGKAGAEPRRSRRLRSKVEGLRRLGPGRYEVSREWLSEAGKRAPSVSAVRHVVDGEVQGFRLRGVSGPLSDLGLRDGDVLTNVNGLKVDSPDAGFAAYQRCRKADRINLVVLRGGARVGLSYVIVD